MLLAVVVWVNAPDFSDTNFFVWSLNVEVFHSEPGPPFRSSAKDRQALMI
jgi:hypothetical protein